MEKEVPLGTYSFIVSGVCTKDDEVFTIRNQTDLLCTYINHRTKQNEDTQAISILEPASTLGVLPALKRKGGQGQWRD